MIKRVVYFDKYSNLLRAKPTGAWAVRYASNVDDYYLVVQFIRKRKFLFWDLPDKTFWISEGLFNYFIQDETNNAK